MKVVLVEDSSLIATQLLSRLEREPMVNVVGHAIAEDDAVALILSRGPDAVILDLGLKSGSGLGVIRRIRAAGCGAQVLILTNFAHPEVRDACLQAGGGYFFDKHTEAEACIQTLTIPPPC